MTRGIVDVKKIMRASILTYNLCNRIILHYHITFPVAKKASLKNIPEFKNCLSSVFNIAENDGPEDILIYKRVAHFNTSDSINAFITYLYK